MLSCLSLFLDGWSMEIIWLQDMFRFVTFFFLLSISPDNSAFKMWALFVSWQFLAECITALLFQFPVFVILNSVEVLHLHLFVIVCKHFEYAMVILIYFILKFSHFISYIISYQCACKLFVGWKNAQCWSDSRRISWKCHCLQVRCPIIVLTLSIIVMFILDAFGDC